MSPLRKAARLAGALYLVVIATAFFAEFFARGALVVSGDAAATARNIGASERMYRLGGAADLVNLLCDIGVAVILYRLLRPAGPTLARYAALTRIAADLCLAFATFFHFAALHFLRPAGPYLASLTLDQRQALAYECLRLHDLGYATCLVFFGVHMLATARLVLHSQLLPRPVGLLLLLTGACYLLDCTLLLVFPEIAAPTALLLPGLLSECVLAGWLLLRGVDEDRWQAAAGAVGLS